MIIYLRLHDDAIHDSAGLGSFEKASSHVGEPSSIREP